MEVGDFIDCDGEGNVIIDFWNLLELFIFFLIMYKNLEVLYIVENLSDIVIICLIRVEMK